MLGSVYFILIVCYAICFLFDSVAQGPRSSSVPRRALDDPNQPNYSPENVNRSAPKSQVSTIGSAFGN